MVPALAATRVKDFKSRGLSPDATMCCPWYLNPQQTTEFQAGTDHGWQSGHGAWNNGRYDSGSNQKKDALTMGYLKRQDVSFTMLSQMRLLSATPITAGACGYSSKTVSISGAERAIRAIYRHKKEWPRPGRAQQDQWVYVATSAERWKRMDELAGVSGGTGLKGDVTDNFTDNSLEFFAKYQVAEGASAASGLVRNGVSNHTLLQFHDDVTSGRLPQVSWIVPPEK